MPPRHNLAPMDMWLLIAAPLAVGGVVALIWWLGGWSDARLPDTDAAVARYLDDDPLFAPGEVLLSADGRAAVIMSADGVRAAVVRALGDRQVTRPLGPGALRDAALADTADGRTCLTLSLADATCRRVVIDVTPLPEGERQAWCARLDALARPAPLPGRTPAPA